MAMQLAVPLLVLLATSWLAETSAVPTTAAAATDEGPPHILLFVLDDVGFADVSYRAPVTGNSGIPTPFIDSLVADGVQLDRYYTHTVCTPSRLSLLTGRYSHMLGFGSGGVIIGPGPYSIPRDTPTPPRKLAVTRTRTTSPPTYTRPPTHTHTLCESENRCIEAAWLCCCHGWQVACWAPAPSRPAHWQSLGLRLLHGDAAGGRWALQ